MTVKHCGSSKNNCHKYLYVNAIDQRVASSVYAKKTNWTITYKNSRCKIFHVNYSSIYT